MNEKNEKKAASKKGKYVLGDGSPVNFLIAGIEKAEKENPGYELLQVVQATLVSKPAGNIFSPNKPSEETFDLYFPLLRKISQ